MKKKDAFSADLISAYDDLSNKLDVDFADALCERLEVRYSERRPLNSIGLDEVLAQARLCTQILEQLDRVVNFTYQNFSRTGGDLANFRLHLRAVEETVNLAKQSSGERASVFTYTLALLMRMMFDDTKYAIGEADELFKLNSYALAS